MATFNDLQQKAKKLSDIVSKKVVDKAPRRAGPKGGNLKRALSRANTFDSMIELQKGSSKVVPVKTIELNIDYAPDGAEYGMWWNEPTLARKIKNGKTANIPESINFAEKALADPKVQKALDGIADIVAEMITATLEDELADLGK